MGKFEVIKKFLEFLASISVGLLLAAAGLYFDADQLTFAGVIVASVAASGWLLLRFNPRPDPKETDTIRSRRRELIRNARTIVSGHTQRPSGQDFREMFEGTTTYAGLRRHLSKEFMGKFHNRRLAMSGTGKIDPFAKLLLDELDRLEKKWGIENS